MPVYFLFGHVTSSHIGLIDYGCPLGLEQALALVRFPDSFAEGDKLPKTEGTFDFPSQATFTLAFHKKIIGLSLYLREYKPVFYELKYEVEINLLSQHAVSQVLHSCARYTAVNTDHFASFFFAIHSRMQVYIICLIVFLTPEGGGNTLRLNNLNCDACHHPHHTSSQMVTC